VALAIRLRTDQRAGAMSTVIAAPPDRPHIAGKRAFERLLIEADRCKGCELCIQACAPAVLALDRTKVNVLGYNPIQAVAIERCTSCALCARVCPDAVFTVYAPKGGAR
jgi:2-oxoglutarate ferredoxin oxidoreductase subunit delta